MDLLHDLLRQAGLRRRLLDLRRLAPSTALRFPCERSLGLHVVTHGRVHLHRPGGGPPIELAKGDVALMARGCDHWVATEPVLADCRVQSTAALWPTAQAPDTTDAVSAQVDPPGSGGAALISGAYQLWNRPLHPFFAELPDWFVLRADELPRLSPLALTVGLLDDELSRRRLGADTLVHGLLDVVFTYLLRELAERQGLAGPGWCQALRDAAVARAVAAMHAEPAQGWTLESLARQAGLSRTVFAERFRQAMGETPLAYLRTVRLQRAMWLLAETDRTLEQVAEEVGYQDAFGFSKVFKRTLGLAPRDYRRQDREERAQAFRFGA